MAHAGSTRIIEPCQKLLNQPAHLFLCGGSIGTQARRQGHMLLQSSSSALSKRQKSAPVGVDRLLELFIPDSLSSSGFPSFQPQRRQPPRFRPKMPPQEIVHALSRPTASSPPLCPHGRGESWHERRESENRLLYSRSGRAAGRLGNYRR